MNNPLLAARVVRTVTVMADGREENASESRQWILSPEGKRQYERLRRLYKMPHKVHQRAVFIGMVLPMISGFGALPFSIWTALAMREAVSDLGLILLGLCPLVVAIGLVALVWFFYWFRVVRPYFVRIAKRTARFMSRPPYFLEALEKTELGFVEELSRVWLKFGTEPS